MRLRGMPTQTIDAELACAVDMRLPAVAGQLVELLGGPPRSVSACG